MVNEWRKVLKNDKLTVRKPVCERHFRPEEVEWRHVYKNSDGYAMGKTFMKVPRRKPGVVPSIFLWTDDWNSLASEWEDRKQYERELYDEVVVQPYKKVETVPKTLKTDMQCPPKPTQKECENVSSSDSIEEFLPYSNPDFNETESTDDVGEIICPFSPLFNFPYLCAADIALPKGWIQDCSTSGNCLSLFVTKVAEPRNSPVLPTFVLKNINVISDLEPQIYVLNEPLEQTTLDSMDYDRITSLEQLEKLIAIVDHRSVCEGPLLQKELEQGICKVAHKYIDGIWRHNNCSLVVDASSDNKICTSCRRLKCIVHQILRRTLEISAGMKRTRVNPPERNERLYRLHKQGHITARADKRVSTLSESSDIHEELRR